MVDFETIAAGVRLAGGAHDQAGAEMCVNEMVAWYAGEDHSARPLCECPVLGHFAMSLNDLMGDRERQNLIRFIPRLAGSRDDRAEWRRAHHFLFALDRLGREGIIDGVIRAHCGLAWEDFRFGGLASCAGWAGAALALVNPALALAVLDEALNLGRQGGVALTRDTGAGEAARRLGMVAA